MKPPRVSRVAGAVFLLAIGLPFLLAKFFIPPNSLEHKTWDIAALLFGSAGIFSAMREAQRLYSGNALPYLRNYALSQLSLTNYLAGVEVKVLGSRVREYEARKETTALAEDYSNYLAIAEKIHAWSSPSGYRDQAADLPSALEIEWGDDMADPELQTVRATLGDRLGDYQARYNDWASAKAQVERNALEEFFLLASPFLLSAAVFVALLNRLNQ